MFTRIARLLGVLAVTLALAGCALPGSNAGSMVGEGKDNASIVTCRTNRDQLAQQYSIAQSGAAGAPVDFAALVAELKVKCPSGGAYSWDDATAKARCSIHGE